mgnify:FL=1
MSQLLKRYLLTDLDRPRYLSGRRITSYLRTFCEVADEVAQDILDARGQLLIESASRAALLALARNANDRGFAREQTKDLAAYLLRILTEKRKAGTEDGLRAQFARMGMPAIEIVKELDLRNAGVVNGFGGNEGFFFIIVRAPFPFASLAGSWDGGGTWDDDAATWGTAITPSDQADIGDVLRRWKPAGTSCRFILFDEDGTTGWGPAGLSGNYQELPYNEAWEYLPPSGVVTPYYNVDFLTP